MEHVQFTAGGRGWQLAGNVHVGIDGTGALGGTPCQGGGRRLGARAGGVGGMAAPLSAAAATRLAIPGHPVLKDAVIVGGGVWEGTQ